jgi:hypothetical protein
MAHIGNKFSALNNFANSSIELKILVLFDTVDDVSAVGMCARWDKTFASYVCLMVCCHE